MHNTCPQPLLDTPSSFGYSTFTMAISKENRRRLSSVNLGLLIACENRETYFNEKIKLSMKKLNYQWKTTIVSEAFRHRQIGDWWHIPLASSLEVDVYGFVFPNYTPSLQNSLAMGHFFYLCCLWECAAAHSAGYPGQIGLLHWGGRLPVLRPGVRGLGWLPYLWLSGR